MKVVGVMSGTSLDGLDLVLIELQGSRPADFSWRILDCASLPYASHQRERIDRAIRSGGAAALCGLHVDLGEWIAQAVLTFLARGKEEPDEVRLIGSHGQTVWHVPPEGAAPGSTLQIGNASVIAEVAGVDVISDFRARDMAAGGHGAPLTAYLDRLIFTADAPRLIQNIGGIGNVTVLPAEGRTESPVAFDTGPGVVLIDGAARALTGESFDMDGRLAAAGAADEAGVEEWLADPFFRLPPPRST
ncbi:MAG: anhydro-N-acetylmuramic acid kinase, partial [Gemmatimonadetes bacterium]|nr:anhydro-N-acetylmuramic acid kinase [Gemmatimonadota bacterium]